MKKFIFVLSLIAIYLCVSATEDANAANTSNYYQEVLEFDEEGNLLMTTHDKKATSKVTYRTLGWIIKRYDAPLDAPGQKYAVIKMRYSDIQYRDDPNDSAYMYCYYYGDKQEIYDAVNGANKKWKNILYNYGDYVYIDEIMTVCSNGVPLGTLESSSSNCIKSTGEVYYDYEGIAGARNWASKVSLLTHFDKKVKYPSMVRAPEFSVTESKTNSIEYNNRAVGVGTIGSNTEGNEIYDVTSGIPVTENLYVKANVDSAAYDMKFDRYVGRGVFPVKVITTYHFKWTDYYGNKKTEDVEVVRWYLIERAFSYWRVDSLGYKYLSGISISNYALPGGGYQTSGFAAPNIILEQSSGYKNHVRISSYTKKVEVDGGTINGKDGLRPDIPEEDYSYEAEKCVGVYRGNNDYLKINDKVILSNEDFVESGISPYSYSLDDTTIYRTDLGIPLNILNGYQYESTGRAYYTGYKNGKVYSIDIQAIEPVTIHTPVYCESRVYADNAYNQEINPDMDKNNVVIGKAFGISVSRTGNHRNIKGYGYRDYSKYIKRSQIKFPIDIYYNGSVRKAGEWIDMLGDNSFVVPVGIVEGNYEYIIRNIAINAPTMTDYSLVTDSIYNSGIDAYVAEYRGTLNVIGRIYGLKTCIRGSNKWFTVGNKNENGNLNNSDNVMLMSAEGNVVDYQVVTVGGYSKNSDKIDIDLKYFYIKDGKRIPVNVYKKIGSSCVKMADNVQIDFSKKEYIGNSLLIKALDGNIANKGAQLWKGELDLTGKLIVLPLGDYGEKVLYKDISSKAYRGGDVILNMDIYAVSSGTRKLSYINADNWNIGCCNMWNKEGFDYKDIFKDGDCLFTDVVSYQREDYDVVGTH